MTDRSNPAAATPAVSAGPADLATLADGWLQDLFAPWVKALHLRVESVSASQAVLVLPFDEQLCREGGTLCGQSLMAAADTAMVVAIAASFGQFRPMTTVTLNTSFMRAVSGGDVRLTARVLKPGRTMVFAEVELAGVADGKLAAHITGTCALL